MPTSFTENQEMEAGHREGPSKILKNCWYQINGKRCTLRGVPTVRKIYPLPLIAQNMESWNYSYLNFMSNI